MAQQLLERVRAEAAERQREFEKLAGDWRGQIRLYRTVVRDVTRLQARMCAVFGTPEVVPAKAQSTLQGPRPAAGVFYRWQDGVVDARELLEAFVKFRGACIVQTQSVEQAPGEAVVRYTATLKVDENYFLERALPSTKSLRVHDPNYTLYAFDIRVPRGELVRESLHALSSAMRARRRETGKRQPSAPAASGTATFTIGASPAAPWTVTTSAYRVTPATFSNTAAAGSASVNTG